jgi:uncharacterized protein with von Willebrand factor type A (vWA) domain
VTPELLPALVGFAHALRAAGLRVGSGQVVSFSRALALLDVARPSDVYWAGRVCLVSRREDLEGFDRVFRAYFLGMGWSPTAEPPAPPVPLPGGAVPVLTARGQGSPSRSRGGVRASDVEVLRRKRFDRLSPEELETLRALVRRLAPALPVRRCRRRRPAPSGDRLDLRRTLRRALRTQGEVLRHVRRARRTRRRRLVLLLDVSGSMAPYSRALVEFAHAAARGAREVEVFCFGTRISRVTEALRHRHPDRALEEAARAVADWEGGTRIGESIRRFLGEWGRRGIARGAVVVICSDGLERGDPDLLGAQMARLARLARRIVWVNPLRGDPRYEPLARGMRAALPHVDVFVPGHDLASLEALAALLPALG